MKKYLALIAACLAIAASGTSQQPGTPQHVAPKLPAFSADAAAERIVNLDAVKKQVKQYHDCTCTCGCYAHDLDARADRALAFLRRRAAQNHSQKKLAVVLDIDETTLSNYPQLLKADFAYDAAAFDAWVLTAQAPAISGTLRLYQEAQKLGVDVFFITGRPEAEREATERNLRQQGIDNWKQLTMRTPATHAQPTVAYKSAARAAIAAEGYKIVLNVGDQWSDLKGPPQAEFSVKYPDPFYFIP